MKKCTFGIEHGGLMLLMSSRHCHHHPHHSILGAILENVFPFSFSPSRITIARNKCFFCNYGPSLSSTKPLKKISYLFFIVMTATSDLKFIIFQTSHRFTSIFSFQPLPTFKWCNAFLNWLDLAAGDSQTLEAWVQCFMGVSTAKGVLYHLNLLGHASSAATTTAAGIDVDWKMKNYEEIWDTSTINITTD